MIIPGDYKRLEQRVGRLHLKQRLGMQADHHARVLKRGHKFFHSNNRYSFRSMLRAGLRVSGLHRRGLRNMARMDIQRNVFNLSHLPAAFDGFTVLHLSDLHLDIDHSVSENLIRHLQGLQYDLCVITGDFRASSFGCFEDAMEDMARVRPHLTGPVYGILGNHDYIEMIPRLEDMGIQMLLNESTVVERDGEKIYLAGIDDPHFYQMDNLEKAAAAIPHQAVSILLSHAPRVYRWAAHADFDIMLCGHTHGGQVCMPNGRALVYNAQCPRRFAAGAWRHHDLHGYTSVGSGAAVVEVRFNCPPEITLHTLLVAK